MKPYLHAELSLRRRGRGWLEVHDFMDMMKMAVPDARHRVILHNELGIALAGKLFGEEASEVAREHVLEDLGWVPSVDVCESMVKMPTNVRSLRKNASPSADVCRIMETTTLLHHSGGTYVVERVLGGTSRGDAEDWLLLKYGRIWSPWEFLAGSRPPEAVPGAGTKRLKKDQDGDWRQVEGPTEDREDPIGGP